MLIATQATRVLLPPQQRFCSTVIDRFFVSFRMMTGGRKEVAEFGRWLAAERGGRFHRGKPLSTTVLARLMNAYAAEQGLPVKRIAQQEISVLENATIDRGPKRFQPWFRVLREFIENGALDAILAAASDPDPASPSIVVDFYEAKGDRRETVVRTPDGRVVGSVIWRDEDE